jgi:transposase InsO family protein
LAVIAHPTAEWIARQFKEAIGWRDAPRYLVRDRDRVYGSDFIRRIRAMGIRDRPISARSPWQNGYAERLIGSIRRECLDMLLFLANGICAICCVRTSNITMSVERTCRWTRMRRSRAR